MPIPNAYRETVVVLAASTAAGQIGWKPHEAGFIAEVGGSTLRVWDGADKETNHEFVAFGLLDPKGKHLDSWYIDDGDEDFLLMTRLLVDVRRAALGIPDRLRSIIEALREKGGG